MPKKATKVKKKTSSGKIKKEKEMTSFSRENKKNQNPLGERLKKSYQKKLLDLKEVILGDLKMISGDTEHGHKEDGDVSGHALHMADVATDMYDKEFSLGLASNDRELLHRIDMAFQRLLDGSFGLCEECGCKIGKPRLEAIPYAETCLKCQEEIDKKNERSR